MGLIFAKLSFRMKIVIFTLCLFFIISIIQLTVTSFYFRTVIIDKSLDYFKAAVSQVGANIDSEIAICDQLTNQITESYVISYFLDDIVNQRSSKDVLTSRVMMEVLKMKPEKIGPVRDIYIFPIKGTPINCYYTEALDSIDLYSELLMIRRPDSANHYIIWDDHYHDQNFLSSYSPIIYENNLLGLVRIRYEKDIFGKVLNSVALSSENTLLVINDSGRIIYSNKSELIGQQNSPIANKDSFLISSPLSINGWSIAGIISNTSVYKQIAGLNLILLILFATFLLFVLLAIISYSNRLLHPLNNIVMGMKQIQQSNIDVHLESGSDEFGFIAENFNHMVERIRLLLDQVYNFQIAARKADQEAIEAKLNPHFLYNTLDMIYWMLIMKDNTDEADIVIKLSDLLRYSISHRSDFVELREDLIIIENYIILQQLRYKNKYSYSINIPEDIKNIRVPKLLLQPLVENIFKHAFSDITQQGLIEISGCLSNNEIYLSVKDNGRGISQSELENVLTSGIGLKITNDRIQYAYGKNYGIEVKSPDRCGTEIILKIGMHPALRIDPVSQSIL